MLRTWFLRISVHLSQYQANGALHLLTFRLRYSEFGPGLKLQNSSQLQLAEPPTLGAGTSTRRTSGKRHCPFIRRRWLIVASIPVFNPRMVTNLCSAEAELVGRTNRYSSSSLTCGRRVRESNSGSERPLSVPKVRDLALHQADNIETTGLQCPGTT